MRLLAIRLAIQKMPLQSLIPIAIGLILILVPGFGGRAAAQIVIVPIDDVTFDAPALPPPLWRTNILAMKELALVEVPTFSEKELETPYTILLGMGDGNFAPALTVDVGNGPRSVALGDINRDEMLDVVTANFNSDDVSILLGMGDGNFAPALTVDVGQKPQSVALGDINRDEMLDVVTANFISDDVSILLGMGDGSIFPAQTFRVGDGPYSVALGDIDGNAVLDVVTANFNSDDVSILLNSGNGVFIADQRFVVGRDPSSVALMAVPEAPFDVNGDGFLDIVTANGGENSVSILRSDDSLKNIEPTVHYERVTIDGRDELVFYLTLEDIDVPLGPSRTFTVRAFLPGSPEPGFIGSKTQTFLSSDIPVVVNLQ